MKTYPTIGCCGIDCGLCPRYHTDGPSACPGCDGVNFKDKHPSCGFVTCCVTKHGFEVCSDCPDYPCKRFDPEKEGYDSFVTHQNVFANLDMIKKEGIEIFLKQQSKCMAVLVDFLENFNDGRSKSFFCLATALLPLDILCEAYQFAHDLDIHLTLKERNTRLKDKLKSLAET
ncbi:MAG: DUF3795 domain-containing protein, partial [Candidatus Marinimicrobia bacterium]|nr:DUF3795 domain-containing protein [Candidatus Neomarinimicrobiota bacterium]